MIQLALLREMEPQCARGQNSSALSQPEHTRTMEGRLSGDNMVNPLSPTAGFVRFARDTGAPVDDPAPLGATPSIWRTSDMVAELLAP